MSEQIIVRYSMLEEARAKDEGRYQEAVSQGAADAAPDDGEEQARLVAAFNNGMGMLADEDSGSTVMSTARSGLASRIQSTLVEYAKERGKLLELRPAAEDQTDKGAVALARLLEVQFDSGDWWGWLKISHYLVFKPKPAPWQLPPEQPEPIANDATIAVFSDWATGLYGAPYIQRQVLAMERCDVVLHLGDTYYAGRGDEITSRLIGLWPTRNGGSLHRTLNGNHEMYSGGGGYFAALAKEPFKQSSSCIALQNDHWLLLGLDTSYKEATLDDSQVDWIKRRIAACGTRKVLLFSHHQCYSKFEKGAGGNIRGPLAEVLTQGRIHAWYFGHEHRLVLFEADPAWGGMKARCMGHGGFPEFRKALAGSQPAATQWLQLAIDGAIPAAQILDGPNEFVRDSPSDPAKYVPHGYAVLQFAGADLFETFYDPRGVATRARAQV